MSIMCNELVPSLMLCSSLLWLIHRHQQFKMVMGVLASSIEPKKERENESSIDVVWNLHKVLPIDSKPCSDYIVSPHLRLPCAIRFSISHVNHAMNEFAVLYPPSFSYNFSSIFKGLLALSSILHY